MFKLEIFQIFLILLSAIVFLASPASAAELWGNTDFLKGIVPCGTSYAPSPCTVCHFFKLLQNIINFLLYVSASLATLMAAFIAFLFLLSGGSPKKIEDAKSKLWLLVWGLIWILGSWLLLNTIINVFANPGAFPWQPWNQISC